MCDEDFINIPDYEGFYKINKNGQIFSMITNKILKPTVDRGGYFFVTLCKNGAKKIHRIHRLMGITFLNVQENEQIDHINRNKLDNNLSNLRIATNSQNSFNKSNVVGYTIYYLKNGDERFTAKIMKDKKQYTKTFKTIQEAQEWRDKKEIELFGEFEKYKEEKIKY